MIAPNPNTNINTLTHSCLHTYKIEFVFNVMGAITNPRQKKTVNRPKVDITNPRHSKHKT